MAVMKTQQNQHPLTEAEEIEAMLPWLVSGKLSRAEAARVTRYLEAHPEAAAHVALARDEQSATISGNEAIKAPSTAALDRLMASLAETPQSRRLSVLSPASVWEKIAGFIGGFSPTTLGIAGAAAALVLVAQAATIGVLMTRDKAAPAFETATGDPATPASDSIMALVMLQPGITADALTAALADLKATVVDGPRGKGLYRLKLAGKKADGPAEIAKLKAKTDVFAFVGPAP
jgi:hypothetical protein